jgi:amino acid permease
MVTSRQFLKIAAIVAAATIGSGVFALPYVVAHAGWLLVIFYFIAFAIVVSAAHVVYLRTLESVGEKERLLGLARKYFGTPGFWTGFIAIVVGLLLSFTAYLILGPQFVMLIFPAIAPGAALALFWFIIAAPVFLGDKSAVNLEELGIFLVSSVIIFVFLSGHPFRAFLSIPPIDLHYFFLPLGVILFSLAGWTSIEPVYGVFSRGRSALGVKGKIKSGKNIWIALATGTVFAAALYFLFAMGILGSAPRVTEDTLSGLLNWPSWERDIIAVVGLFAVWTASVPISRELRNALEKDLRWNPLFARFVIVGVPLAAVTLGFNNFLVVVSLTGGLFLSTQYLLILSVGSRALAFSRMQKVFYAIAASIFIFAAIYSVYSFVVK